MEYSSSFVDKFAAHMIVQRTMIHAQNVLLPKALLFVFDENAAMFYSQIPKFVLFMQSKRNASQSSLRIRGVDSEKKGSNKN